MPEASVTPSDPIRIYNTLSGSVEAFVPLQPGRVGMYVCGPTVYDDPHIGHLRSAFAFDVIARVLRRRFELKLVRNVTDVDDKIIDRAARDGSDWKQVSTKYLAAYQAALAKMGIDKPTEEPKATGHIAEMIAMTQKLVAEGKAYAAGGSVYFRVRAFAPYGALSHQKVDEILQNSRVEAEAGKEDPLDFALWKAVKPGEPSWPSPWGEGRPGWHIECSAMTLKCLGEEFDIHGGGRDLLFPHHENERAQSMAATAKTFARVWIHHGLLTIEGKKMAKSLGNFVTLEEITKRGHSIDTLKLLFLQSHYRSDVDFTWAKMQALEEARKKFEIFFGKNSNAGSHPSENSWAPKYQKPFDAALQNDFDTPAATAVLFDALHAGNARMQEGQNAQATMIYWWIAGACKTLGLFQDLLNKQEAQWIGVYRQIVSIRDAKRKAKEYKSSDYIRDELKKLGFHAEDTKSGSFAIPMVENVDAEGLKKLLSEIAK